LWLVLIVLIVWKSKLHASLQNQLELKQQYLDQNFWEKLTIQLYNLTIYTFSSSLDTSFTLDKQVTDNLFNGHIQNALGGFIFVLAEDGQVLYISQNVSENLGLQQVSWIHVFYKKPHSQFFDFLFLFLNFTLNYDIVTFFSSVSP